MIFTERTITVVNDSATINKPLILYRGDKNIELKITIAESQFKFRNTDASNVIETTDASYAQLVINTPYNSPIFSDVAATKNGAVIFVISAAMIDEIREVGAYEIQIRLLDDNKQSRASIPPVSNAIEIREPIAIEDGSAVDSNAVNAAKVNRALTTTSAPLEAFDSQGNYIKNNWGDGDPITDAALNKMEAGIDGVNKKIGNVRSQIKDKANKEDIGAPSQEQVNTWLDNHPEATTTIRDNSITGNKMNIESMYYPSEYSTSETFVTGKYIGMSGNIETEVSMAYFKVDVIPNTQYEIKSLPTGTFFAEFNDDNSVKVYHEWDGLNNTTGLHIITTSSTTNNIRINLGKNDMGSSNFYCKRYGERKIELKWLNTSKWFNKKAVIIGDSITAGADGASSGASSVPKESNLPNQLKDRLGLNEIINYGASGTTIAQTSGNDNGMGGLAFVNRFSNMDDDADLVIVFGGTNDYGSSYTVDFGTPSDTEKTTFYGALNYLCNGLIEKYNGKTIVFMTPLHRDIETANVKGKTLLDYVNAIKEVCQTFGIPVIDTYNISGFTPKNNSFKQAYLPDGLHPNEIGYKLLAERIYKNFELF